MKTLTRKFFAVSIAALCALAPAVSDADKVARVVADYTVFLDPPTSSSSSCRWVGSSSARWIRARSRAPRATW